MQERFKMTEVLHALGQSISDEDHMVALLELQSGLVTGTTPEKSEDQGR